MRLSFRVTLSLLLLYLVVNSLNDVSTLGFDLLVLPLFSLVLEELLGHVFIHHLVELLSTGNVCVELRVAVGEVGGVMILDRLSPVLNVHLLIGLVSKDYLLELFYLVGVMSLSWGLGSGGIERVFKLMIDTVHVLLLVLLLMLWMPILWLLVLLLILLLIEVVLPLWESR